MRGGGFDLTTEASGDVGMLLGCTDSASRFAKSRRANI